jgi:hypothetical protein
MQKSLITVAVALGLMVGAMSLYAVAQPRNLWHALVQPRDTPVDLGPPPITEPQLRERLAAAGFRDIFVTRRTTFETLAAKDGVSMKLAVDAQSGTVTRIWDDNDDDN